jgi:myo-inositol catabolism protein IolC
MSLGYDGRLYILAFDHRGSFQKKMFGIAGAPDAEDTKRIADAKSLIFEGFQLAVADGAPRDAAGVLADEQFGEAVARQAKADGSIFAMPVEKSGQDEFDFEYGDAFGDHIADFDPTFSKVLVRWNPDGDADMNKRQGERLARLSDWLHERDRKFLFELLVPAEPAQLESVGGSEERYDTEVRPGLMVRAIEDIQTAGIEPDIWKIEGVDSSDDCARISATARAGGRDGVACVVLGRGADDAKVDEWLRAGANVPGYIGFAIGRSIFWDGVKGYVDGTTPRADAARQIADKYLRFISVYEDASSSSSSL